MTYGNLALSDDLELYEYWIAADNNNGAQNGSLLPANENLEGLNWGRFRIAGDGPLTDVVGMKIIEAQIPASWYIFNEVNQNFYIDEVGFTSGFPGTKVTVPIGNYTSASILPVLTAALNAASGVSGSGNTWTVTFNQALYTITFTASTTDFTFRFGAGYGLRDANGFPIAPNSGNKNPRLWLGFPPGDTSSTSKIINSPYVVNLSGPPYIYINSSGLGPSVHGYLPEGAINLGKGQSGPQMAKIPVTSNSDGWIFWQDPQPQMFFELSQPMTITEIDFYLTLGGLTAENPLNLRGGIFSFKLAVLVAKKYDKSSVIPTLGNDMVGERTRSKKHRIA